MWRSPACQTLSKVLDISSATGRVAPDLLKTLAILSDRTTVRRSAIDREDLKPYWKSEKKTYCSMWSTILLFFSKQSKFGPNNLNCLFQMKVSTKNISNKLNTMVMFAYFALDQKYACWSKKSKLNCSRWNLAWILIQICWIRWWRFGFLF